ncbi:helix-turn-helix transcriptional regulator [Pyramidobacter piscolens]|uniref:helix-turn-helix transcriptional regulator n=1 Tax=Pyramidobacter piscolens TaxID=638849 RepID=UPI001FCC7401|nr:helix-turn-helix domain-containing protein [Pyramidobacter piscolens]BDF78600.1 hypothetical protein CE91St28_13940 [Pyramidobacter piscolens]
MNALSELSEMSLADLYSGLVRFLESRDLVIVPKTALTKKKEDIRDKNLTIRDVAKQIGVSESTVRRMIDAGTLSPGTKVDGRRAVRWSYQDIEPCILQHQKNKA